MEDEGAEHKKKQVDHQENIMLKNQSTISPTNDEEKACTQLEQCQQFN
jgi:hypothetical protein